MPRCTLLAAVLLLAACAAAHGQTQPTADSSLQLVWADEFNVDGPPDSKNWNYERGFVRNEELQWYQPQNATCHDGLLVIEARRVQFPNPRFREGSGNWERSRQHVEYTSACILTRGKHEWTFGRFEMRGRIDTRPGLWPAFWTLGSARSWPGCGEIDVMEYYRGRLLANVCWAGRRWEDVWSTTRTPLNDFGEGWADEFHVWRLDWNREQIQISVDDKVLNTTSLATTINRDRERSEPFHEPHYLLLNLAIGGTNGGDPAATEFPAKFEVDYVRVYQPVTRLEEGDSK